MEAYMHSRARLVATFSDRKEALLEELELVHHALAEAKPSEENKAWLEKMKKWHDQLQALVDDMPKNA